MNAQLFDSKKFERTIKAQFGFGGEVSSVIAYDIDVAVTAHASLFLTKKKQLLCYITAESRLTLGDVRKMLRHMGLRAELYLPPRGQAHYFDEIGRAKFREVFPGRRPTNDADIDYYRTLAPYNPALVMIAEVHDGVIYQYDRDASGGWRPGVKFAYRRIKTSLGQQIMDKKATPSRTLNIDGLVNARDLGGLRRRDGTVTPYGVFYRSESVDLILASGWDQLRMSGIRTVVDLRQQSERERDEQTRPSWLTTIHCDLDGIEDEAFWKPYLQEGLESTSMYYLDYLQHMPERAGEALRALAMAPAGGVLFHCKSGRDRTGLVALLLLSAADVEPEEIVDDYLETVRLGSVRGERLGKANPEPGLEQLLREHGTSTEESFRNAVAKLEYSDFLKRSGLSEAVVEILKTWRGSIKRLDLV